METQPERQYRILIADDCPDARTLVEIALEDPRHLITVCEDGEEAIRLCEAELPDLAVLDWQMPGATGLEVCDAIKSQSDRAFVPVMLLTSQSEIIDKVTGLDGGADDYVTKPFALPELCARVKALLRVKDLTDRLREARALLAEQEKQLVAAQVAGAAAHELGQPLTSLLLSCELLDRLNPGSDQYRDVQRRIAENCGAMRTILNKLSTLDSYRTREYVDNLEIIEL